MYQCMSIISVSFAQHLSCVLHVFRVMGVMGNSVAGIK